MKDMTKASNPFYLALFLLIVCGVSTLVMAYVAVKTDAPIKASQAKETAESLKMILPPFDNDPASEAIDITSPDGEPVKLYTAKNGGLVVGYAAEAVMRVLAFGFETAGFNRIFARILDGNTQSVRVAEKCRMRYEATHKNAIIVKGEYNTYHEYAILKKEFLAASHG